MVDFKKLLEEHRARTPEQRKQHTKDLLKWAEERVKENQMFEVTAEDILRSKIVTPGLYACEIVSYKEDEAKDKSALHVFEAKIVQPGDFLGVPLRIQFSEKAMGFALPFLAALGVDPKKPGKFDPQRFIGKKIRCNVVNDTWQGNPNNKVTGYATAE